MLGIFFFIKPMKWLLKNHWNGTVGMSREVDSLVINHTGISDVITLDHITYVITPFKQGL